MLLFQIQFRLMKYTLAFVETINTQSYFYAVSFFS